MKVIGPDAGAAPRLVETNFRGKLQPLAHDLAAIHTSWLEALPAEITKALRRARAPR